MGQVRLYATLRRRVDGSGAVEVPWSPGDTIGDVMGELVRRKPALDGCILDEGGGLLPHVSVFLDGRDIRHLDGLETRVERDTEISVFPPVAGGQRQRASASGVAASASDSCCSLTGGLRPLEPLV